MYTFVYIDIFFVHKFVCMDCIYICILACGCVSTLFVWCTYTGLLCGYTLVQIYCGYIYLGQSETWDTSYILHFLFWLWLFINMKTSATCAMCVEPWQHPGSINTDCIRKKRKTPAVASVCSVDTRAVDGSILTNSQGRPTGKATGKQQGKTARMILPGLVLITPALWNPTFKLSPECTKNTRIHKTNTIMWARVTSLGRVGVHAVNCVRCQSPRRWG